MASSQQSGKQEEKEEWVWGALAEALFVVLPLIVLMIVKVARGITFVGFLGEPAWSLGTAVLMGQAIVKLIYAAVDYKGPENVRVERHAFLLRGQ